MKESLMDYQEDILTRYCRNIVKLWIAATVVYSQKKWSKLSTLKLCKELNRAFSRLMKQMALEPINSFPREYSSGVGAWCLMGFGLEQKACLDADTWSCSNLCLGTVWQLGWDQGISKVTSAPPVLSCSLLLYLLSQIILGDRIGAVIYCITFPYTPINRKHFVFFTDLLFWNNSRI